MGFWGFGDSVLIRSSTSMKHDGDDVVDLRKDEENEHGGHNAGYKMLKTEKHDKNK